MLKVAVNVELAFTNPTGMGRHARSILAALQQSETGIEFTFFYSRDHTWPPDPGLTASNHGQASLARLPYRRRTLRLGCLGSGFPNLRRHLSNQDVYHDFSADLLNVPATRRIASLHDISILETPESYTVKDRLISAVTHRRLRKADRIITVSEFSKEMIRRALAIQDERIAIVYNGVAEHFRPVTDIAVLERITRTHGVNRPFILFYGVACRRKNLSTLVKAFDLVSTTSRCRELSLVLCGTRGVGWNAIQDEIDRCSARANVRLIEYLPDEDLVALISAANCVVMPSIHEGFGLPVIEAMACGTPVICGNGCAFPEIAGDAALLVEPTDVRALADAIESVITDSNLAEQMRSKGLQRCPRFNWQESARQLLQVYQSVA